MRNQVGFYVRIDGLETLGHLDPIVWNVIPYTIREYPTLIIVKLDMRACMHTCMHACGHACTLACMRACTLV